MEVNSVFKFLNFSDNQKVLLTPCGLFYMVAVLLTNAHTILHRPQTPQYFHCLPPSLNDYFHGVWVEDEEMDGWCAEAPWAEIEVPADEAEEENEEIV
jgi:hypothetical protein